MKSTLLATLLLSFAILSLSLVTGCARSKPVAEVDSLSNLLGQWQAVSLMGKDVKAALPAEARLPLISFNADGQVSGFTGVNRLSSTLDIPAFSDGTFKIADPIITKMAGSGEAMAVEQDYLQAITQATGFGFNRDHLHLTKGNETLATFIKYVR